jgi:hypothetical protein
LRQVRSQPRRPTSMEPVEHRRFGCRTHWPRTSNCSGVIRPDAGAHCGSRRYAPRRANRQHSTQQPQPPQQRAQRVSPSSRR